MDLVQFQNVIGVSDMIPFVFSLTMGHNSRGHFPPPGQFPPFYIVYDSFPFHQHHPPIYNVKRSTIVVYKIDSA